MFMPINELCFRMFNLCETSKILFSSDRNLFGNNEMSVSREKAL